MPHCPSHPPRSSASLHAALSACAMAGIVLISVACATPTTARPPTPVAMIAMPEVSAPQQPPVRRATGQWARRRLGYTALSYQMPDAPEVLQLNDDDHCELARLSRDEGRVRYEVRSFEHEAATLHNVDQLIAGALTDIAQRVGGVRRSQVALTQGGYPGVDLTYDFPQTRATVRVRMLVGRTRSYAAIVSYPIHADAYLRDDVARFHQGLEFDEGDLPEPDGDGALGALRYVEPVGAWFAVQMPGSPHREARTFTTPELTRPRVTYTVGAASGAERFVVAVTASFERRAARRRAPGGRHRDDRVGAGGCATSAPSPGRATRGARTPSSRAAARRSPTSASSSPARASTSSSRRTPRRPTAPAARGSAASSTPSGSCERHADLPPARPPPPARLERRRRAAPRTARRPSACGPARGSSCRRRPSRRRASRSAPSIGPPCASSRSAASRAASLADGAGRCGSSPTRAPRSGAAWWSRATGSSSRRGTSWRGPTSWRWCSPGSASPCPR